MDQLKEFLRQVVRYRFPIVVGVAALLPIIGYFASAGAINEQAETKAAAVKSAFDNVKKYQSGIQPNDTWRSLTEDRTGVLDSEIRQAWEMLYQQQAPLLTWPPEVAEQYTTWGPQWPADVSASTITLTNNAYAAVYPKYVDEVYASFRPFNYEDGTGIVVAPVKETLLRPVTFSAAKPPTLGKVWAAQQKLWIQRTVLNVIDKVNAGTENWDEAPLKQITKLEVANPEAQDQKSIVEQVTLVLSPEITRPGDTMAAAAAAAATTSAPVSDYEAMSGGGGGQMASMAGYMGSGGYPGMGGGATTTEPDEIYIFEQAAGQQFREIPVYVAVLIDQSRVLDLIEAFRRSPMSIQVVDFEMKRSDTDIKKPEKGEKNPMFSGYGGYGEMFVGGNSTMMGMMRGMMGGGGAGMGMPGYGGGGMGGYEMMGGMGGMPGYGGMGARAPAKPQGKDIASEQFRKLQEQQKKAEGKADEKQAATPPPAQKGFSDPYYNIVEVHIYGRARFYDPPPAEEPASESLVDSGVTVEGVEDVAPAEGAVTEPPVGESPTPTGEAGVETAPEAVEAVEVPTDATATETDTTPAETDTESPVESETDPGSPAATDTESPAETPASPEPAETPEPGV